MRSCTQACAFSDVTLHELKNKLKSKYIKRSDAVHVDVMYVAVDPTSATPALSEIYPRHASKGMVDEFKHMLREYESPHNGAFLSKEAAIQRFKDKLDAGVVNIDKCVAPSKASVKRPVLDPPIAEFEAVYFELKGLCRASYPYPWHEPHPATLLIPSSLRRPGDFPMICN